ncbi:hypothetical protein HKB06_04720 [Vibrio parahaemolyticus]|nr:hypothetical protein [Vibrio parahaemolyticus]
MTATVLVQCASYSSLSSSLTWERVPEPQRWVLPRVRELSVRVQVESSPEQEQVENSPELALAANSLESRQEG